MANAVLLRKVELRDSPGSGADVTDGIGCELSECAPLDIDRLGNGFEMIGIDAMTDATQMVQYKTFGGGAVFGLPCHDVSESRLAINSRHPVSMNLPDGTLPKMAGRLVSSVFNLIRRCGDANMMIRKVANVLACNGATAAIRPSGDRSVFSAPAHAQTGRVRRLDGNTTTGTNSATASAIADMWMVCSDSKVVAAMSTLASANGRIPLRHILNSLIVRGVRRAGGAPTPLGFTLPLIITELQVPA